MPSRHATVSRQSNFLLECMQPAAQVLVGEAVHEILANTQLQHAATDAMAHTDTMTTAMGVESCTTCHGTGSAYDVDLVHARPGL
jgi:hypothetical protein